MRINGKSIYKNRFLLQIMLLCLSCYGVVSSNYLRGIFAVPIFIFTILLILASFGSKPASKVRIWIFLCYGTMFVASLVGPGSVYEFFMKNVRSFALCLMFDLWLTYEPELFIDAFPVTRWLGYLNLIAYIFFPNGIYFGSYSGGWLLGQKNVLIHTLFPTLTMSLVCSYWKYGRISPGTYFFGFCCAVTFALANSAGSTICFLFFIALLLIFRNKTKLPKMFTLKIGLLASLLALILVFFTKKQLVFLAGVLFNKGASMIWRLNLWEATLELIKRRPLLGYGQFIGSDFKSAVGMFRWTDSNMVHPHNTFLFILITGGVVLAGIVIYGYHIADLSVCKTKNTTYNKIILFTLYTYLLNALLEVQWGNLPYVMLVLGMHAARLMTLEPWEQWSAANGGRTSKRKYLIIYRRPGNR